MINNILIILCTIGLTACGSSKSDLNGQTQAAQETQYSACIEKGVKYYTSLRSYPTLSSGESADSKIRQKCDFNTNVFD